MKISLKSPLLLSLIIAALWGVQYARRAYWNPDEPRFTYVAREMVATGNYLVPHRNGDIYAHKPPLMFWLIQVGEAVLPKPFGSRLPSLLGVFLALLSLYKTGKLLADAKTGVRAVLLVSTSWLFWSCMGSGQIDPLLTGLEMLALWRFFESEKTGNFPFLAFIAMGFGILAKGPVGVIIPTGAYLCSRIGRVRNPYEAITHGSRFRSRTILKIIAGLLLTFSIPAAWLGACAMAGAPKEYFREIVFSQNLGRVTTAYDNDDATPGIIRCEASSTPQETERPDGRYGHRRGFLYFFVQTPLGFLPWTLLLPLALITCWRTNELSRRAGYWALFVILFFSIPVSKRGIYIMMALPAMALVVANAWDYLTRRDMVRRFSHVTWIVVTALAASVSVVASVAQPEWLIKTGVLKRGWIDAMGIVNIRTAGVALAVMAAIGLVGALDATRKIPQLKDDVILRDTLLLATILTLLGGFLMPTFNDLKTADEIHAAAVVHIPTKGRLLLYKMNGENLALSAERMGQRLESDQEICEAMTEQRHGIAIFEPKCAQNLNSRFDGISLKPHELLVGSKKLIWVIFDTGGGKRNEITN